jgi:hypothetical protein
MKYMSWSRPDYDAARDEDIEAVWELIQAETERRQTMNGDSEPTIEY